MDLITEHVAAAQSRLLSQYSTLPRLTALVATLAQRIQMVEQAIYQVYEATPLATAIGQQLDNAGAIIGLARNGLDDATYRVLLYGQIALNNSDATTDAVINLVRLVFQATDVFFQGPNTFGHNRRLTPAQLSLQIADPATSLSLKTTLLSILKRAMPAGVNLTQVDIISKKNGGTFAFAGNQPWVAGFEQGAFCAPLYQNPLD